jgi:hypothetical protein
MYEFGMCFALADCIRGTSGKLPMPKAGDAAAVAARPSKAARPFMVKVEV